VIVNINVFLHRTTYNINVIVSIKLFWHCAV